MGVRAFMRAVTVLCLAGFSLALWSGVAVAGECPNEVRRKEQNATYLPDCRAYEMVSPVEKKGSEVNGASNSVQISDTGERASFETLSGIGEAARGSGIFGYFTYATKRGDSGWGSPYGLDPQPARTDIQLQGATVVGPLSASFETAVVQGYQMANSTNPDIPENTNMYEESVEAGTLTALTSPFEVNPATIPLFAFFHSLRGSSSDLAVVSFQSSGNLLPGLPFGEKLYEWNHGKLEVAGVLPDGTLPEGGSATVMRPVAEKRSEHIVSADGSSVLFTAPADGSKPVQLYMRRNGTSTAWVSQSESSTPNPEPEGIEYLDMSADGKKVLFATPERLTDTDPGGESYGLYMYTDSPNPESEQNLTFIARAKLPANPARNLYTGMSEDGKRIYFFSQATEAFPQTGTYLWDEGTLKFVAATVNRLVEGFESNASPHAETSADGRRLAFTSNYQLTEAPVGPPHPGEFGESTSAMYLYDETTASVKCVSCLPSGAPQTSPVKFEPEAISTDFSANIEGAQPNFFSRDGRFVFFSTADALVPADVDGVEDVYEYDVQTGTVSLLSSGTSGDGSWFSDASPDGSNVLFVSRGSYLREDDDRLIDAYDVRVNGGFPQPPPSTGGCVGDDCQGIPSAAPSFNTASGFVGLGNVVRSSSGKAKPKGLTSAQKLKRALKACRRSLHGKRRHRCEARARKRFAARKASKGTSRAATRR